MMNASQLLDSPHRNVEAALDAVKRHVATAGNALDNDYFKHRPRYDRNMRRVTELCPPAGRILDVGSHYLHTSAALAQMGYRVTGMDVAAFSQQPLVLSRAETFGVENVTVDNFAAGDFLPDRTDAYDLVLFSEILEHITFNPILFWNRIYNLLAPGGFIFISTPNSLTLWKMLSAIKRIMTLDGIGITVPGIFNTVTYGHHWKEYSAREVHRYFQLLSPDFSVSVTTYNYRVGGGGDWSLKSSLRKIVETTSRSLPWFREELDVAVRLNGRSSWPRETPRFL